MSASRSRRKMRRAEMMSQRPKPGDQIRDDRGKLIGYVRRWLKTERDGVDIHSVTLDRRSSPSFRFWCRVILMERVPRPDLGPTATMVGYVLAQRAGPHLSPPMGGARPLTLPLPNHINSRCHIP